MERGSKRREPLPLRNHYEGEGVVDLPAPIDNRTREGRGERKGLLTAAGPNGSKEETNESVNDGNTHHKAGKKDIISDKRAPHCCRLPR